jgi:DNA repair protein RadC
MRYQRAARPPKLDGPEATRGFFAECFADPDPARECLWVAHVDAEWNCLHLFRQEGDKTGGTFLLRAIIASAVLHTSAGIFLAHNHPSGDPQPSVSDCLATRRRACAAQSTGCTLIDHFVFSGAHWSSFRRLGLL